MKCVDCINTSAFFANPCNLDTGFGRQFDGFMSYGSARLDEYPGKFSRRNFNAFFGCLKE